MLERRIGAGVIADDDLGNAAAKVTWNAIQRLTEGRFGVVCNVNDTLTDPQAFTQPPNRKPIAAHVVDPVVATSTPDVSQPIGHVTVKDIVTITGLVKSVQIGSVAGRSLEVQVLDQTGGIRLLFFGRTAIAGIVCGAKIRATGRVGDCKGHLALANPRYELLP